MPTVVTSFISAVAQGLDCEAFATELGEPVSASWPPQYEHGRTGEPKAGAEPRTISARVAKTVQK